ncbi:hypothetical protein LOK49_LG09G00280 [Camellia lanceoleosa]|uniref:Uncharacterized protein n=1 Tax=Camellia lanceoleosa TaxID=1840588 RepID=A0ACC0GLE8_9ERIC|nr:hypothetical protein LOK49_LG09G00280 [Camellia lanceoleosa]
MMSDYKVETINDANRTAVPYEKSLVPIPDEKLSLSKTLAILEKDSDLAAEKKSSDPTDNGSLKEILMHMWNEFDNLMYGVENLSC